MKSLLKRLLKEPLIHFLVVGGLIFAIHGWFSTEGSSTDPGVITIPQDTIDRLNANYAERTGQWPTDEQQQTLIDDHIDEEVLYREALALGLDESDTIVRRRLIQIMTFLAEDMGSGLQEPTDEELQAYLDDHPDQYWMAERISLIHVFINRDRDPETIDTDAHEILTQLQAGADPTQLGDPFILGNSPRQRSQRELANMFGPAFAEAVFPLPLEQWSGPIESSFGLHLVRLSERLDAGPLELTAVRQRVRQALVSEDRERAFDEMLDVMRGRYVVEVVGEEF